MSNVLPLRPIIPLRTRRARPAGGCPSLYRSRRRRWVRVLELNGGLPRCELGRTAPHPEGHAAGALRWGRRRPAKEAS